MNLHVKQVSSAKLVSATHRKGAAASHTAVISDFRLANMPANRDTYVRLK